VIGMRVLALTRYTAEAASSRQRFHELVPLLEARGITLDIHSLGLDLRTLTRVGARASVARRYWERAWSMIGTAVGAADVVWVQMEIFPFLPPIFERVAALRAKRIVLDLDDAWYLRYRDHPRRIVRSLLGGKYATMFRHVDALTAGNKVVAEFAQAANPRIDVFHVPTTVSACGPRSAAVGVLPALVGWLGSPTTTPYLGLVEDTLATLAERLGDRFRMITVGAPVVALPKRILPFTEVRSWSLANEAEFLRSLSIGLMPLPSTEWAEGKSAFKLIQYMSAGVPVVASNVGENQQVVRHGESGYLATTPEEWLDALLGLIEQPATSIAMGQAGRLRFETDYSTNIAAARAAAALLG
jgi:glycosyltransferase involved in cell wall biosynthesis